MVGKSEEEVKKDLVAAGIKEGKQFELLKKHKVFKGNKPTTSIMYDELNPRTLGKLIAMYEHKVFVMGTIWDINSFDQWGVELGKQLATRILKELGGEVKGKHDSSTEGLMKYYLERRE